jgi:hypothetical protein
MGSQLSQTNSTTAKIITYEFAMPAGQALGAGSSVVFAAQTQGGKTRPSGGDSYTVTYTTGGETFSQSGTF